MPTTHPPLTSLPRLVRDIETIDAELRLMAPVRRACRGRAWLVAWLVWSGGALATIPVAAPATGVLREA